MSRTPAGQRNRRVRFERASLVRNALGVMEPSGWTLIERAMAKVLFGTGQERRAAGAEGATQTATFRVLSTIALRTVTESDRVFLDGRGWSITSIAPIGVNDEIEFTATVEKG